MHLEYLADFQQNKKNSLKILDRMFLTRKSSLHEEFATQERPAAGD